MEEAARSLHQDLLSGGQIPPERSHNFGSLARWGGCSTTGRNPVFVSHPAQLWLLTAPCCTPALCPKPCVHPQGRAGFAPWQPYGNFPTATGCRESEGTGTDPQPPRTAEDARSPIACWGFRAPREPPRATDSLNKGPHRHEGLQSLAGQARPYHQDVNKPQRQQQHPKDKTPLHGSTSLRQQHGPGAAPSPT